MGLLLNLDGGLVETDAERIARLESENAALRGQIERRARQDQESTERELLIGEKTKAGLSRAQAEAVIRRQAQHDAEQEKEWAKRRPEIIELLKEHNCLSGRVSRKARAAIREINGGISLNEIVRAQKAAAAAATETAEVKSA